MEPIGFLACPGIRIGRDIQDAVDSVVRVEEVAPILGHAEASRKAAGLRTELFVQSSVCFQVVFTEDFGSSAGAAVFFAVSHDR
jgi:hypothetical protein